MILSIIAIGWLVLVLIGVPIGISMILVSMGYFYWSGLGLAFALSRMVDGLNSFPMLAVPLFILAAAILNGAGITNLLFGFARAAFADTSDRARAAIDRSAAAVARQIADLTALFGLDRVAIGGGVGLAPGYLLRVQSHLTSEPELFRVPVNPASLGQDSALIGALMTEEDIS